MVDNDGLFTLITRGDTTDPSVESPGWTLLGKNAGAYGWWLYWRLASSESATYTWQWAASSATKITVAAYRSGFDLSHPICAVSNTSYTSDNTMVRAATFNVPNAYASIIYAGSVAYTSPVTFTKPTELDNDWLEDYDEGTALSGFSHTFGHCEWSSSGDTGDINIIASTAVTAKHAFAVALYTEGHSPSPSPSATVSATPSATPSATAEAEEAEYHPFALWIGRIRNRFKRAH